MSCVSFFPFDDCWPRDRPARASFRFGRKLRYWTDSKGKRHLPRFMSTEHLFYALRMVFNHSVPEMFRVGAWKRRVGVAEWSARYRKAAIALLATELEKRALDYTQADELNHMRTHARVIKLLGL